jgi:hypothetical protein
MLHFNQIRGCLSGIYKIHNLLSISVFSINPLKQGVGIAQSVKRLATGWTDGVLFLGGVRFFYLSRSPNWLQGPSSLLSNGYWGLMPWGLSDRCMKLTTHLHLFPRLQMVELYLHSPICFRTSVLN